MKHRVRPIEVFVRGAASELGWIWTSVGGGWVQRLERAGTTHYVVGYSFPHNNCASAQLANDKSATAEVLQLGAVPTVPHVAVKVRHLAAGDAAAACIEALRSVGLPHNPAVIKPLYGSSGANVERCFTIEDGLQTLDRRLAEDHGLAVVSPWVEIIRELRIIILDGRLLLVFEKLRAPGAWRHNLAFGAWPRLLDAEALGAELDMITLRACRLTGLRLAAVDLVEAESGAWAVLEVNQGIKLDGFSQASGQHWDRAMAVYREIVAAL